MDFWEGVFVGGWLASDRTGGQVFPSSEPYNRWAPGATRALVEICIAAHRNDTGRVQELSRTIEQWKLLSVAVGMLAALATAAVETGAADSVESALTVWADLMGA